ncbi:hypothetical protein GCM10022419_133700 [Nonomuraea rosea]|uniref:Transposase n=1 Tax=Nonomuraea rosea TaxID=638574 RepID=A0ABP7A5T7_9ACTN
MPLLRAIPPAAPGAVRRQGVRPRQVPAAGLGHRGQAGHRPPEHGSGLGVHRWVIEQTIALLHWFRRLRIRWEIRDDIHEAFMTLAAPIICWRRLNR